MKVTIEVRLYPLEARQFMGFPDVQPIQAAAMAELEKRIRTEMERVSPGRASAHLVYRRSAERRKALEVVGDRYDRRDRTEAGRTGIERNVSEPLKRISDGLVSTRSAGLT